MGTVFSDGVVHKKVKLDTPHYSRTIIVTKGSHNFPQHHSTGLERLYITSDRKSFSRINNMKWPLQESDLLEKQAAGPT